MKSKVVYMEFHGGLFRQFLKCFLEDHPRIKAIFDEEYDSYEMSIRSWKRFCNDYRLDFKSL